MICAKGTSLLVPSHSRRRQLVISDVPKYCSTRKTIFLYLCVHVCVHVYPPCFYHFASELLLSVIFTTFSFSLFISFSSSLSRSPFNSAPPVNKANDFAFFILLSSRNLPSLSLSLLFSFTPSFAPIAAHRLIDVRLSFTAAAFILGFLTRNNDNFLREWERKKRA